MAVDIDGTLADYYRHFHLFAEAWIGIGWSGPVYRGAEPYWVWFTKAFDVDRATFRAVKLAYRQGGMKRTQPPLRGAAEFMRMLSKLDAEIWLTTTRPHDRFDRVDPDTREWLRRHYIPFDGLLYDSDKYAVLAERVDQSRVVAILDDLPEQIERAAEVFGKGVPILIGNPWNEAAEVRIHLAESQWKVPLELSYGVVEERINKWRSENA